MNAFGKVTQQLISIVLILWWLTGIVIAQGFWQTVFALFPLYSYYLVVEHFLTKFNLL